MHTKTTFNAGTGFNRYGETLDPAQVETMAIPAIRAILARAYRGFTESVTVGGWQEGEGNSPVITEPGRQWVVMDNADHATIPDAIHKAREVAGQIAAILDQAAVLASVEELHFEFITSDGVTYA